jgi:hypothetical protein
VRPILKANHTGIFGLVNPGCVGYRGAMDIKTLLKAFGSQSEIARQLGVSRQAVAKWVRAGEIPALRKYQVQVLLRGKRR